MKTSVKDFAEALSIFTVSATAGHYAKVFPDLRWGILWLFAIALVGCIGFAGTQAALSLAQQTQREDGEVSPLLAVLSTSPALILFLIILFGGLTGVRTSW